MIENREQLIDEFNTNPEISEYNGFQYEYFYPGVFAYISDRHNVFFDPDFVADGIISIQVATSDGDHIEEESEDFKYELPLTSSQLFNIVKPTLDRLNGG